MKPSMKPSPKMAMLAALLALGLPWLANGAAAETRTFGCPSRAIETGIREAVPSPWFRVFRSGGLTRTWVEPIGGGRSRLVCDYGPAGRLTRIVLPPWRCRPAGLSGFTCTAGRTPPPPPPPPAGPRVVASGTLTLPTSQAADLDRGRVTGRGADIRNLAPSYIRAVDGAMIADGFGRNPPGYEGCRRARYKQRAILPDSDRATGFHYCVRTNEGRISVLRLRSVSYGPGGQLVFDFTTWE